jgi:hypothetical protein
VSLHKHISLAFSATLLSIAALAAPAQAQSLTQALTAACSFSPELQSGSAAGESFRRKHCPGTFAEAADDWRLGVGQLQLVDGWWSIQ